MPDPRIKNEFIKLTILLTRQQRDKARKIVGKNGSIGEFIRALIDAVK